MYSKKLDKNRMRQLNTRLIFEMIYRHKRGITRAQLAQKTKMSAMNVGRIVDSLMEQELVTEHSRVESGAPGRPATKLLVRRDAFVNLGIAIDLDEVSLGLVNPYGKVLHQEQFSLLMKEKNPKETLNEVGSAVKAFLAKAGSSISVAGATLPGVVNHKEGIVKLSSQLGWRDVPVGKLLEESIGFHVLVENDVKARAKAESWCGAGQPYDNSVLMMIGSGIGAGLVIGGDIYRGKDNMAGEIGHIAINGHSRLCECGQMGCLQTTITETAILREARIIRPDIDMNGIAQAYQAGEGWACKLIDMVIRDVLAMINLLANSFASEAIILCGSFIDRHPIFRQMIQEAYERQQTGFLNTNFDLCYSTFGTDGNVIGASTVAFAHMMKQLS